MKILLISRCVGHEVLLSTQKQHGLLPHTEDDALPVSIFLEFLEHLPETREAGLSHAKHGEATPHLPEVGGPTAPHSAQYIHLLSNIPHQEVASLHQVVLGGGV